MNEELINDLTKELKRTHEAISRQTLAHIGVPVIQALLALLRTSFCILPLHLPRTELFMK